ncbi:hypothetical protein DLM45_05040 [Hyphomicrobium methylovorum]|uniref:YbdD/YjiX family protein n=1 Tax=Hyphomicrobium methylovorum TaxID=84 RepID=UPI0015E6CB0C|nr:YbdD/YjiX family protein [Hyphomicrobium methylovorum]MBA2125590.1 hypothetical protein [Hyphomicrobium methylovorum]
MSKPNSSSGISTSLLLWGKDIVQTARLMIGLPDYDGYVRHRQEAHPGEPVMSYEEFFRERQANRYGEGTGKISRCC